MIKGKDKLDGKNELRGKIMLKGKKGDMTVHEIIKWILAFLIFGVIVFAIIVLSGKGGNALNYIKNIFRFGR